MDKIERDETYESESVTDRSALNMQSKIPFKEIPGARQADQRSHTNVRAGPAAALNASSWSFCFFLLLQGASQYADAAQR